MHKYIHIIIHKHTNDYKYNSFMHVYILAYMHYIFACIHSQILTYINVSKYKFMHPS